METNPADRATNLAEPLEQIVSEAHVIVRASVASAEPVEVDPDGGYPAQTAVLAVDEILKGEVEPGDLVVAKPASAYFLTADADDATVGAKREGLFVLRAEPDEMPMLFGYHGVHDDRQRAEFDRLLAGLPRQVALPTDDDIRALAARADAVVVGPAVAEGAVDFRRGDTDYTSTAVVEVQQVIQGDVAPGDLRVVRGRNVFEVGARWGFPTDIPNVGVYFLDLSGEPAVVLNPIDPFRYQPTVVERALAD